MTQCNGHYINSADFIYFIQSSRMYKVESRLICSPISTNAVNRINQIINQIYATKDVHLDENLRMCSQIVSELLQNDLIGHLRELNAAKWLCYELVLYCFEEESVKSGPKLAVAQMEQAFENNKRVKLNASLRNTLTSINEILEGIIWKDSKKKSGTGKKIDDNTQIYQDYLQFKGLLADFDRNIEVGSQASYFSQSRLSRRKSSEQDDDNEGNEALIEQLEDIVAKKEKRIKEMTEQLQEHILEQKQLEDLIEELENRNGELSEQVNELNQKLIQREQRQLSMDQQLVDLKTKNLKIEHELSITKKKNSRSENSVTKHRMNNIDEDSVKKQYRELFDDRANTNTNSKQKGCQQCEERQEVEVGQLSILRKMLLTQAITIEALI